MTLRPQVRAVSAQPPADTTQRALTGGRANLGVGVDDLDEGGEEDEPRLRLRREGRKEETVYMCTYHGRGLAYRG